MSSIVSALQSLGSDLSGVFGGGNNNLAAGNMASAFNPMGNASPAAMQGVFQGTNPAQAQGPVTPTGGTQTGATPNTQSPVNMSAIGQMYMRYLIAKRLQQRQAPGFSVPYAQQPQFNPFPQTPAAIMPPQVQL